MRRRGYTPNDTRDVIRLLSVRYAGSARGRNRILLVTVILCIAALTMVFGITRGKIRAEELNTIRTAGTAASGVVEDGNASQYASLKAAGYISQAGRCVTVGPSESEGPVCSIRWADADAWEKLLRPAYTEIRGNYPEQEQEIMLSGRALNALGITDPEVGMEISLRVVYNLFQSSEETFVLSGWFTDHGGEAVPGYVSEKKLSDWGIRPDKEADLLFRQADRLDWQETETRLYEDLHMSDPDQKITVSDTAAHQAVSGMMGGYGMAALGTVIVLCGIFFLCHNVLQISMAGDIRQLGLLNTEVLLKTGENGGVPEGIGRIGRLPQPMALDELAELVKKGMGLPDVRCYGETGRRYGRVAVSGGSGKMVVKDALAAGAEVLVTGDIDYHTAIDAMADGMCIIDAGHYGTEYCFIAYMAERLRGLFPECQVKEAGVSQPFRVV